MNRRALLVFFLSACSAATFTNCGGGGSNINPGTGGNGGGGSTSVVQVAATKLVTDTFTNPESQHATSVEPSAYVNGSTIVSVFQTGRIFGGGATAIGFSTSTDSGATWHNGIVPGITTIQGGGGTTFAAVSDPAVAFDAKHNVWILSSLGLANPVRVLASRSVDGITWGAPAVMSDTPNADKNWIICDNTATSAFYGSCYVVWDDPSANGLMWFRTSRDGGVTWESSKTTSGTTALGIGAVPQVTQTGRVVVPYADGFNPLMMSTVSTDGGASWAPPVAIAQIIDHLVAGSIRTANLPASAIDAAGRTYVAWSDCRFRTNCTSNDIVISTSDDGTTWSAPVRVPIDATTSTVDHFLPSIGVDRATSGATAHLALTYYWYANTACATATCQMNVSTITSSDGGATWSAPKLLAGPMSLVNTPSTSSGFMVGDYFATVFSGGKPVSIFAAANPKNGAAFDQAIYGFQNTIAAEHASFVLSSANDHPVPNAKPDHEPQVKIEQDDPKRRNAERPPLRRARK